jgi:hypothetical protein
MALIISKVKRDTRREDDGAWMPVPDADLIDPVTLEVPELLVRGNLYIPYQNALSAMNFRHGRRGPNAPPIPADQHQKEFGKIIATHLLLDWRGISEPYSRELAEELCMSYDSPVSGWVLYCAANVAEVAKVFDSATAGNSARSSDSSLMPIAAA